jgi:hypothetical protein
MGCVGTAQAHPMLPGHGGVLHGDPMADEDETRWMTYSELGQARGIGRASAERLARKKRWQRMKDNTGFARVAVPLPWLTTDEPPPPAAPHDRPQDRPLAATGDADAISALREAIAGLLVRAERAETAADRERTRAEHAEAGRGAAEAAREAALAELRQTEGVRDAALEAANRADAELRAAQERLADMERSEAERQGRGRWRRIRDAWRGG